LTDLAAAPPPPTSPPLSPQPILDAQGVSKAFHISREPNQAALLAAALARQAGVAVTDRAVRLRDTPPQVGRSAVERRGALQGAFAWRGPSLRGRTVWLVDDVVTTGATLAALATAVQQAGAARIEGVAAAMVCAP
jgi:predicted amidophosphoribosyltransferase